MKIKALGYITIESTDPQQWLPFLTDVVGFVQAPSVPGDADTLYFKMDEYCWRVCVFKSDRDRFCSAGWELETEAAYRQAIDELKAVGVFVDELGDAECGGRRIRECARFQDPAGNDVEIFYNMQLDYTAPQSGIKMPLFETGYHGDMGLGHFVLPTSNFKECHDFYGNIMGFGQTDYMHFHFSEEAGDPGQGLHFMHVENPRHHSLAIYEAPQPPESNCIHLMFEVHDIDEVGYFIDRCKKAQVPIVSSLGKHSNDLMISVYVASPGGFAIEFGCDGVQLDWSDYKPTESAIPSLWGHDWQV